MNDNVEADQQLGQPVQLGYVAVLELLVLAQTILVDQRHVQQADHLKPPGKPVLAADASDEASCPRHRHLHLVQAASSCCWRRAPA